MIFKRWGASILCRCAMLIALLILAGCCRMYVPVDESIGTLDRRGQEAYRHGRYQEAEQTWKKGLELARKEERTEYEAKFMVHLSQVNESMGRYHEALKQAVRAIEILESAGDQALLGMALIQKGLAYRRLTRYQEAGTCFDQAFEIARRLENPRLESESLRNIASLLQDQGQLDEAIIYFDQAIGLARACGDKLSEARSLNNLGLLFDAKAEYPKALAHHQKSLDLRRKLGDRAGEGKVLGNICITFSKLNQPDRALHHCQAALKIARDIGDQQRVANNLNNIGSLYRRLNQPRKALRCYKSSLEIKRQLSDIPGQARTLNNIGETYWHLGNLDAAERHLERSLQLKAAIKDLPGQSASYQNLALLHIRRRQYQKAKSFYLKALFFNSRARRPELIWRAYDGLSYVYEYLSLPELAIIYGKQALKSIQDTRADLAQLQKQLRLSYLVDKERVYKHVADLLIGRGRLPEAQQVVSLLKEEEYFHYLDVRGSDESSVGDIAVTKMEQQWIKGIDAFEGELGKVGYDVERLEAEDLRGDLTEEKQKRLYQLYDKADDIQEKFEAYLEKLDSVFEKKDGQSGIEFGKKDLENLQSLQGELAEYKLRTAIVTFLILNDGISIILTAPRIQIHRGSLIAETELNRMVFDFKKTLFSPDQDPRPQAKALYDLLISPIEKDMVELHLETLMISPDGTLRYLPFAALFDGDQYLTEKYNLALFTPAAKRLYSNEKHMAVRIAGLGTSEKIGEFSKLAAVEKELDVIVKEDDEKDLRGVLPGKILLNRDFTAFGLASILRQKFPFVHLASHFSLRPGMAEDSFILLGDGNRLTLSELKSSRYPFQSTKLLTLSACETAIGGKDAQGREIESFATLALKSGAKAILATLWPVADVSTGTFMQLFYQLRNKHKLSKAESLREVQKIFLTGTHNTKIQELETRGVDVAGDENTISTDRSYAHPFYWAPFILMGNHL